MDEILNSMPIKAQITTKKKIQGKIYIPKKIGSPSEDIKEYEGEYEVVPKLKGETLPTKERYMEADLVVKPIPIYETTNNSGGVTVYIAKE